MSPPLLSRRFSLLLVAPGLALLLLGLALGGLEGGRTWVAQAALPPQPLPPAGNSPTALVPSTWRDFFLPGSQPNQMEDELLAPGNCTWCHGDGYSAVTGQEPETETWAAWAGSMMAQSARDPLFYAALDIANGDADKSGDFCLRCHVPRGWLEGRATVTDGSAMTDEDREGVQCEVCHRLVDPFYSPENPERDLVVLAGITTPVTLVGNSAIIVDPLDHRRGPLVITEVLGFDPHETLDFPRTLTSPYHEEAALCGSCHDFDNPLLSWDEASQRYLLNPLDEPGEPGLLRPLQRTYSEWLLSDYNSPEGIYAPQFGGNQDYVSTCQDCHMRQVTGVGGVWFGNPQPLRDDFPLHDMTGANTWVPQTLPLHPVFSQTFAAEPARAEALVSGRLRARTMLQNAASLAASALGNQLLVTVTNQSGHKLPTGYAEGRRMWLEVAGYGDDGTRLFSSGFYDAGSATLIGYGSDPTLKVYEARHALSPEWAAQLGLEAGPSFQAMLNDVTEKDNRIPPRGYQFAAYAAAGAAPYQDGQPDAGMYADGHYWDTTAYALPAGVVSGTVRLWYQVASREYIEFLRDAGPQPGQGNGQIVYELWQQTGQSAPELMAETSFVVLPAPALSIGKSGPASAAPGQPITYRLSLSNGGNLAATNLVVSDTLPAGATYLGSSEGGSLAGGMVTWHLPALAPGQTLTVSFTVSATATIVNQFYGVQADGGFATTGSQAVITIVEQQAVFLPLLARP